MALKNFFFAAAAAIGATAAYADDVKASDEYPEFYNGDSAKGIDFVQSVKVLAPRYCSNVKGDTTVAFEATKKAGCDELDVLECYGGYGPRNPNHGGKYGVTSHWWGQPQMARRRMRFQTR